MNAVNKEVEINSIQEISYAISSVLMEAALNDFLTEEKEYNIKLILNELLANSLEHSQPRSAKMLYRIREKELRCCVIDSGRGFDTAACNMKECPDILSESGRGIYLACCIADWIRYNKKGNMVLFGFTI